MNGRNGNRAKTVLDPVFDFADPDRQAFIKQNAVSLVKEMAGRIKTYREHVARLENTNTNLRRLVEVEREKVPVPGGKVFDYQQVLDAFESKLKDLRAHINEHRLDQEWQENCDTEMLHCLRLLDNVRDQSGFDDKGWNELWDYVKEHMRGWWD